jgi:hypothetical protein
MAGTRGYTDPEAQPNGLVSEIGDPGNPRWPTPSSPVRGDYPSKKILVRNRGVVTTVETNDSRACTLPDFIS